ncbi:MAG: glycosyltransferase family 39 protein [Candidatus Levybacteria bacterium]|nr:glycosyltransferase family 39 protein [Candidatus Levybacteria bacterium]
MKFRTIPILLLLLFLFSRLYNLTLLPIFTDESIYIYWAKYIAVHNSNFFISLTDGKPPLFIWIITLFVKIFPSTWYLVAGRFVSVLAGAITLFGMYKLSLLLFKSQRIALTAAFLGIINSFMLFYDRLALYDSFLSAMLIWGVYFALRTSQTLRKRDAFLWGLFLGLALLTKPPAIIFLFLTPICFLLVSKKKNFILPASAVIIGVFMQSIQKLSENFQKIQTKNEQFQLPFAILLTSPFLMFGKNIAEIAQWMIAYYTLPFFVFGVIAILFLFYKNKTNGAILLLLWLVPIFIFAFVGKIIFPRYILFTTPYFLIACAFAVELLFFSKYLNVLLKVIVAVVLFFLMLRFDYYILTNPSFAPFPKAEYNQYISGKPSGYGLDEVFAFLEKELDQGPRITLVTQGKFGLFPYAFMLKYWGDKRIEVMPSWIPEKHDFDLYALSKSSKVYVVFWEEKIIPKDLPLRLVLEAKKPSSEHSILLTALEDWKSE